MTVDKKKQTVGNKKVTKFMEEKYHCEEDAEGNRWCSGGYYYRNGTRFHIEEIQP